MVGYFIDELRVSDGSTVDANLVSSCVEQAVNIHDREHQKYVDDIASRRKSLVSTGDRSAKIRTYNFPQGRVTDHRIGYTTHDLSGFLGGDIQDMIDALTVAENAEKLKESEL